jgi:hypothetical protein
MKFKGMLIVLVLAMGVVYFIFFAKVADNKGGLEIEVDKYLESKIKLTAVNLESLSREIFSYAAEGDGLPDRLEALRRNPPTAGGLLDAWGRKIRYEKLSGDSFRLRSAGPDGAFDTADDIIKDF